MSVLKAEKFCAAFAWNGTGTKMAAASVAGAMDDDFSSDAYIQIFDASLTNFERPNMPLLSKTSIPDRVHKLDWSPHGGGEGIIAAGLTDGTVCVWSASSLLEQKSEEATEGENPALLYQSRLHQQAVKGCQFNPLQPHFLATGSADKELCIWSFQDPKNPVKVPSISTTTQAAEVTDLRWNPKYAHILAVTLSNGGVVVWDLKAKRPASTFNVSSNATMAASALTWHPEVATQLVVARDDPSPVIQIWDLKKATAPFREIAVHTGGVLAMSWSPFDVNVLVSCGRDGRTCFVNPNTGALLGELPKQDNWVFDVKWAPRTPAVVASASYDSQLALFATQAVCASAEAPKWLSRPSPTVFGYGGRIGHTQNSTVRITTSSSDTSLSKQENEFLSAIAAAPVGTTARADFIATIPPGGLSSVAAAARCSALGEKGPLLEELGVAPSEVVKTAEEVGMPFTGSERDFEQVVARCVACGKFSDAVTVCLKANRFDDGFAIAQMAGKEEVSRVYDAYLERRSPTLRFAKYLGAIAKGDFAQLAADAAENRVPWAEVLAFYSTVVQPRDYSATCSALGAALRDREQLDAAFTCFVAGGDVDNAAATLVAKRDRKQHELVQAVTALEQTVQRQARCKEYAEVLAGHANSLAFEGNFAAAMAYASRAAGLGVHEAAVVADRVRFLVPRDKRLNVAAAFQIVREAPDPYTPECVMLAGKQVPLRTNVAKPVHQPTVAQPVTRPHIVAPGPLTHTQPAPTHPTQPVAPTHPVAPLPHHHHHHHHHTTQPPITHPAPPVPLPPAPVRHADPVATQPVAPVPFTPAPAPTPVAKAVTPAPVAPRPAPTTAGGALQCSSVDTSSVAPENQSIVSAIVAATTAIADKRKREAVDKSATELLRRLASGALSEPVAALLRDFCAKLGTPESKQVWKSLNDNHFDDIAPFLNIKFL